MPFRFIRPNSDGSLTDVTIEASTLLTAFELFMHHHPGLRGWFAVWCGVRLAGYVHEGEESLVLTDLKTEPPSYANPFACGD
jgi:hypothetical protein